MAGLVQVVSTPIGNPDDISARAIAALRDADLVVCEELREARTLLARWNLERPLLELNEHTERDAAPELAARLQKGETLALISDHGTPLLADPGQRFVQEALAAGARVTAVPGASSVLAALVLCGFSLERFRFVGFLPAKREKRQAELVHLKDERDTWLVLEAPYRLAPLLADLRTALGGERRVAVACNLTMPEEAVLRGTLHEVCAHFEKSPFKGEFVVVVQGKRSRT